MSQLIAVLKSIYIYIQTKKIKSYTFFICLLYGIKYNSTWEFIGKPVIHRPYFIHKTRKTAITLGDNLKLVSKFSQNSIGLIQPVFLNARSKNSKIIIGNRVGISGSTISAKKFISIGNDVLIGSGCLITDNDAHNIHYLSRNHPLDKGSLKPVYIGDNVFIGTRSIILKGVIIGEGAVIGAGSVVVKNVPPFSIAAGNPAKVIRQLNRKESKI